MSVKTKTTLSTEITTNFPDNSTGAITPAILRTTVQDFLDSWEQTTQVNSQSGTTYTISVDDYGKLVTFSNGSPVAVTLPQATGAFATFSVFVRNIGKGLVTITPTSSTIDGNATLSLLFNQSATIVSNGTNYLTIGLNSARICLTGHLDLYVTTTGSDLNPGTIVAPFLTLQHAYDVIVQTLDLCGQTITVNVAAGTYTAGVGFGNPWTGGGAIVFTGDTSTPSNVTISVNIGNPFSVGSQIPAPLTIQGFKMTTITAGSCISHSGVGVLNIQNVEFGSCVIDHIQVISSGATVNITGSYIISGGAARHFFVERNAMVRIESGTGTVSGTPSFSVAFAYVLNNGLVLREGSLTYSGSATGKRYTVSGLSLIDVSGGGTSFFPGNVAGTVDATTFGVYLP
jgi:hypothetical protein